MPSLASGVGNAGPAEGGLLFSIPVPPSGASDVTPERVVEQDARAMNREQIERMQLVYGDDDTELTVLLDESLAPRSPDFLVDLALPLLTPQSRLLDVSNGLGRLSVGRYCSDRCLTAARALLALADAEPIGASREARQRRAAAVVLLRAWRSRGGPEPSEVVDAIERTTKTLYV